MNKFYYLIYVFWIYLNAFSQLSLFTQNDAHVVPLLTLDAGGQISLSLNVEYFNSIQELHPCDLSVDLPFFNNELLELELELFHPYTNDFQLIRSTSNGLIYNSYEPDIQSYKIRGSNGWSGSISFMKHFLIGVIKKDGPK